MSEQRKALAELVAAAEGGNEEVIRGAHKRLDALGVSERERAAAVRAARGERDEKPAKRESAPAGRSSRDDQQAKA